MKKIGLVTVAFLSPGCASMDPASSGAVKILGNDQYSISEMGTFGGSLPEHAARYCANAGKKMRVDGNTTQKGLASGGDYAVLIFSCYS